MKLVRKASTFAKTEEILALDKKYGCQNYAPLPFVVTKGQGVYLWDIEGRKFLDCIGAYSAVNQGHCHPRIKAAMIDQMDKLTLSSRALFTDQLAYTMEYLCKTFDYEKSIMINSGVEGGETAIKFARRWGYEVKGVPPNQACVLFAKNNFWGRTLAACASSDDPYRYRNFGPFDLNFKILPFNDADAFEAELEANPHVTAIMIEPIQGEAGVIIPDKDFLPRIRKLCDKHNVLLIFDEVQTGIGRTGKMLAQEHWKVRADMVILGKALSGGFMPISAVLGSAKVFDLIKAGEHGSTFGGNPLAARVTREAIQVIIDERMCENAIKQGDYLMNGLKTILPAYPFVKNLRGLGLFFAFDIDQQAGPNMKKVLAKFSDKGVLAKNTKEDRIRFAPPLIIKDEESQFLLETISQVLKELSA